MIRFFRRYLDSGSSGGSGGGGGDDYTPPELDMATALPPDLRDKPYFKDKSFVDVVKEHANLQTKLGQRPAGIPGEDANDEEWGKFIGAIKPKDISEYELPETEFSKAGKRSEGFEKALRDMAAEVGIPKRQFKVFAEKIEGHLAQAETLGETQKAEREQEFETLLDNAYKGEKQNVIDRTKKLMTEMINPAFKEQTAKALENLSNESLFALTAVLDGVYNKYVKEDGTPGSPAAAGGETAATLTAEAEKIMASKAYSDFRDPGHDAAKQKVQENFARIAEMGKKK